MNIREQSRGRWSGLLPSLGIDPSFLRNRHGPCPICGGSDRFRFDDRDGTGTYFCNQCGAGDGIALVMKFNGWDFKTAAERIEALIGTVQPSAPKPKPDAKRQQRAMRDIWAKAKPIGDVVRGYLSDRGIEPGDVPDLRETARHEMLALVRDVAGNGCQVHRTLLTAEGRKAEVETVRLFMPGPIPKGAAVRLMALEDGRLGIAEGIETALSAAILFGVPCWAALNANMLRAWEPPAEAKTIIVFGDNDRNCTGQAAAYELARRLCAKVPASVEIPPHPGTDWNDVLIERAGLRRSGEAA